MFPRVGAEAAAAGFEAADFAERFDGVWPDNADAVNAFTVMVTQWRVGPGGPIGLDYAQLSLALRQARVKRRNRRDVFDDLRVMEDEALKAMRE